MPSNRCDLIIPGLLPSLHGLTAAQLRAGYPALQRFFCKATGVEDYTDYFSLLSNLFGGGQSQAQYDPPFSAFAAASLGLDEGKAKDCYWISACPVNLFPDRDCLLLKMPAQSLTVEQLQWLSDLLLEQFADVVAEVHIHEQRLLIRLHQPHALKTCSLVDALGKNIEPFLPVGPDKSRWHAIANEIQMVIFQQQDLSGFCNALWFEAAGSRDSLAFDDRSLPAGLVADDSLLPAAAQQLGIELPASAADALAAIAGRLLIVDLQLLKMSASADTADWQNDLMRLEHLMLLALNALKKGRFSQINLHSLDGYQFELRKADLYRFWRNRPLPGGKTLPSAGH